MKWNNLQPRLEPGISLKSLPLPLLLPGLSLLATPVQMLQDELARQLGQNVLTMVQAPACLSGGPSEKHENWLENLANPKSLEDHLTPQLYMIPSLKKFSTEATALLLQGLDSKGYFQLEAMPLLREITGLSADEMESLVLDIQNWVDPPGLFARDIVECLLIQLRRSGGEGKDPWVVLSSGREHLARGDMSGLAQYLGWSKERLRKTIEEIRRLDPRPGTSFTANTPVIPEISFETSPEGIKVRLLHENLPHLTLEGDLLVYIEESPFREQWKTARRVMTTLAMRLRTKLRAARILAKKQGPFLLGDKEAPGPAVLNDIARLMGYHPSTIQRALGTTWALSPRGTLLLSDLLSRPLRARPDLSVAQLRHAIAQLRPGGHSDQDIADGLNLPRRTVAWHRGKMGLR